MAASYDTGFKNAPGIGAFAGVTLVAGGKGNNKGKQSGCFHFQINGKPAN
jgi:hypothetical protein